MARSIKKGLFVDEYSMKKVEAQEGSEKRQVIKTRSRRSTTFPNFIRHTFTVYDERKHVSVYVTKDMVGHKLGELTPTRTFKGHVADGRKTRR